ncbi:MerR family transcriptional regulator [Virgibacillus sp. M23]|uniref:MerR family transcriptional regulator n=1 Tax=Virgibacillus sp. M23 TaxID=3079030 RepID=UPI002A90E188|nr:MerR family transcriptional regulator [Virgibacillus sp. M23]MDY7043665.1 MerR family transcriptional regulator [Virgibacillus sp. M23]
MEVEFVTLGDASTRLDVPSATLRHWTDQLEQFEVHYVMRNNRNERIYYDNDIQIFKYLKDLKAEYGRRTTTKDLAYMIAEKSSQEEMFDLRSKEEAPTPEPSNKTADLLNQEDIQQLMKSERVKQFIGIVIGETTKNLKDDIKEEIRESVREEVRQELRQEMETSNQKMEEVANRIEDSLKRRDEQTTKMLTEITKKQESKGFFSKFFGK